MIKQHTNAYHNEHFNWQQFWFTMVSPVAPKLPVWLLPGCFQLKCGSSIFPSESHAPVYQTSYPSLLPHQANQWTEIDNNDHSLYSYHVPYKYNYVQKETLLSLLQINKYMHYKPNLELVLIIDYKQYLNCHLTVYVPGAFHSITVLVWSSRDDGFWQNKPHPGALYQYHYLTMNIA